VSNVMGYYQAPLPPAMPLAPPPPGLPAYAGAAAPGPVLVSSTDTWVPTSSTDPYVAGMRTSAGAVTAMAGAGSAAANIRFANYAGWKAAGARASAKAASRSGSMFGVSSKMTKGMSMARTASQKSAFMSTIQSGPKTAGVGAAIKYSLFSFSNIGRALASSALVAIPIAIVTNMLDFKAGKVTADQRNALMVADTAGYIATGTTSTMVGGALGSTFLGPVIGTVVGVGAGFALGWVYEKYIRPQWGAWVHSAMYAQGTPTPTPVPVPVPVVPPVIEPK
jgi:hypothetical protein